MIIFYILKIILLITLTASELGESAQFTKRFHAHKEKYAFDKEQ